QPCATPSSRYSLDYRRSDARTVENGFATNGGLSKSAKVVPEAVAGRAGDHHVSLWCRKDRSGQVKGKDNFGPPSHPRALPAQVDGLDRSPLNVGRSP
ncbi:MAG: hypothetical protein P8Y71_12465, partial [Pseudolabrys sp.]